MCQISQSDKTVSRSNCPTWRRFFLEPIKPKLSRKVASGARINLNRYWSKFEEVTSVYLSNGFAQTHHSAADDNVINDNMSNERTEIGIIKYSIY